MITLAVPLLAAAFATTLQARSEAHQARGSDRLQVLVRNIAGVDAVRRGVAAEISPSMALTATRDVAQVKKLGLNIAQAQVSISMLPQLRQATDVALTRASAAIKVRPVAAQLAKARQDLATVRANLSEDTAAVYGQWLTVVEDVASAENTLLARANVAGISKSTVESLSDIAMVTGAAELGGQIITEAALTMLPASGSDLAAARATFLTVWGSYQTASKTVLSQAAPSLRSQWAAAINAPAARRFDAAMLALVPTETRVSFAVLGPLIPLSEARQALLDGVVSSSLQQAKRTVAADKDSAQGTLLVIMGIDALLLLITIIMVMLVRLWVSRSLSRLAAQARLISQGELPDVVIDGPHEVRTVARALAAAVGTLRDVQAQAGAVAAGSLESEALQRSVPGPLGQVIRSSVGRMIDAIRDRESAQQDLVHLAAHDALTDLPNRAFAATLISKSLHRAARSGAMTALMFIDLDHFKAVNDTFGHAAGDHVLQQVSSRMSEVVREGDVVARFGGDEFVVLLENVSDANAVMGLAERMVQVLSEPIPFQGRDLRIGASVGVSVCADGQVESGRLIREADAAAYRAKSAGRGRACLFDEALRQDLNDHADLEVALAAALANHEFVIHYQPVVDLMTGAATGLEALIRWNRPSVGLVSPLDFIPVAESSALIDDIGRFVLGEATRQLAEWTERDPGAAHLTMAVNISARHLASPRLVADVRAALASSGIPAERLVVELTETLPTDDPRASTNMQALRALGVRVALDDFGAGFTSMGQLAILPIDIVKIDRSFVSGADGARQELCKLMVAAAHALGLTVIAEGVETPDEARQLRHMDVQTCQGFLYAAPQPAEALDLTVFAGPRQGELVLPSP